MTLTRKRRKPRLNGTACPLGKRCIATHDYNGRRYCSFHLADLLYAQDLDTVFDSGANEGHVLRAARRIRLRGSGFSNG